MIQERKIGVFEVELGAFLRRGLLVVVGDYLTEQHVGGMSHVIQFNWGKVSCPRTQPMTA